MAAAKKVGVQAKLAAKVAPEVEESAYKFPVKWEAPKKLPQAADDYAAARQARLDAEKAAALLKIEEEALKHWLLQELPKIGANSIGGHEYRAAITKKDIPRVSDWSAVYKTIVEDYTKHAKKKDGMEDGAFSLLGKAIGKAAVQDVWDAGKTVPGVVAFEATTISLTKI